LVIKTLDPDWVLIRIDIQPKRLDQDPDQYQMNTDPKHWIFHCSGLQILNIFVRDAGPVLTTNHVRHNVEMGLSQNFLSL
jgi:hypothetical protein